MALLLLSTPERGAVWSRVFSAADEPLYLSEDEVRDPAEITQIACWVPPRDIGRYPNLKVLISTGAGVDQMPPLPEGIALSRTIAPGIEEMVRDWVVMATLMAHRDMPVYLDQARRGLWAAHPVETTARRRVGIMGMGRIGRLAARSLVSLGFPVSGWSRSGAAVEGVEIFSEDALPAFLERTGLLVCLLPLTPYTRGILNADLLARLPDGAALVHAGRGGHLDMSAIGAALDSGRLSSVILDVTSPEPLPGDHPFWRDPRVIITPHIAANTDNGQGARHALAVIAACRNGHAVPGLVDPERGY